MSNYWILGEDLNGHHACWGSNRNDHQGYLIHSAIEDLQLCVLNNGSSTRVNHPPFPDTIVDISISSPNLLLTTEWEVLDCPHGSDHFPILIKVPVSHTPLASHAPRVEQVHKFNFNKADRSLFSSLVDTRIPFRLPDDPIEAYSCFIDIVLGAANASIPKSKMSLHDRASPL